MPDDSRWDYGIGYRNGNRELALWIEVHSAQTSEVRAVLNKLRWLKDWLAGEGEPFGRLTETKGTLPAFVWLASGAFRLPKTTPQYRLAATAGIVPRKRLNLA